MGNFRYIENLFLEESLPDVKTGIDDLTEEAFADDFSGPAQIGGQQISVRQWVTGINAGGLVAVTLNGCVAGSRLLLVVGNAGDNAPSPNIDSISSSPSLTFAKLQDAQGVATANIEIHSVVFTDGGNITVTVDWNSSPEQVGVTLFEITGMEETAGGSAPTTLINQTGTPQQSITTTRARSIVFGAIVDYNALDGANRRYLLDPKETLYDFSAGVYTAYQFFRYFPDIGTFALGLTAPSHGGTSVSLALIEIREAANSFSEITARASVSAQGTASLQGTGSLSATDQVQSQGIATLSGTGEMTANGQAQASAVATISSIAGIDARSSIQIQGIAAANATGEMTARSSIGIQGIASIQAEGSMQAAASINVLSNASVSGISNISAVATIRVEAVALPNSIAELSANDNVSTSAIASLQATGSLSAMASVQVQSVAAAESIASLQAVANIQTTSRASLQGTGSLQAITESRIQAVASITGQGEMTARGSVQSLSVLTVPSLIPVSEITARASVNVSAVASASITSDMEAKSSIGITAVGSIGGIANMEARGEVIASSGLSLQGLGDITAEIACNAIIESAQLEGLGSLSANDLIITTSRLFFFTPSEITAAANVMVFARASLEGLTIPITTLALSSIVKSALIGEAIVALEVVENSDVKSSISFDGKINGNLTHNSFVNG